MSDTHAGGEPAGDILDEVFTTQRLETERLTGATPTAADGAWLFELLKQGGPAEPAVVGVRSPTELSFEDPGEGWGPEGGVRCLRWLLRRRDASQARVGLLTLRLSPQDPLPPCSPGETLWTAEPELVISPSQARNGFATEILAAVVELVRTRLEIQQLVARTFDPENPDAAKSASGVAAARAATKAGLTMIGDESGQPRMWDDRGRIFWSLQGE